jgi:iron complex outermembrane receptor protein
MEKATMRYLLGFLIGAYGLLSAASAATPDSDPVPGAPSASGGNASMPASPDAIRVAQADPGASGDRSSAESRGQQASEAAPGQLQEIVIEAQRRSERLQDVPISVSAIDQNAITKFAISDIQDVSRLTPGVAATTSFGGQSVVSIRGIVWGVGAATTGIYIDDTPIQVRFVGQGATAGNAFPILFDLDRIEVLRGPQGTLFGSGSEGGTIRFITPQPSLTEWSGYARAELAFLQNGEPSSQFGVSGGGPIIDGKLGFRMSVYNQQDGGWIDRVPFGVPGGQIEKNANSGNSQAINAAVTWAPWDNVWVTPSLYYQRQMEADIGQYWPSLSKPGDNRFVNGYLAPQPILDRFTIPALKISADFSGVTLYSNTSFMDRTRDLTQDYAFYVPALLGATTLTSPEGQTPAPTLMQNPQQQFTQEIRLQSDDQSRRFRWVVGGFFQRVTQHADQTIVSPGLNSVTQALYGASVLDVFGVDLLPGGVSYLGRDQTIDKQISGFGQADFKITPKWTLTAGVRVSHTSFEHANFQDGALNGGPSGAPSGSSENETSPKVGISYTPDEHLLFYTSAAKGFRPGGGNTPIPLSLCAGDLQTLGLTEAPPVYGSDHVWSYELGSKGDALSRRFQWDASVFYTNWSEVQSFLLLPSCGFAFVTNLGTAVSKGFDVQLSAAVTSDLVLGLALGYTDAKYTKTVNGPNATPIVSSGDLLQTAPWHGTASIDYSFFKLSNGAAPYAHIDAQYTNGYSTSNPDDALYDPVINKGYSTFFSTARVGFRHKGWDVSAFAKNLTNSHSVLFTQHLVLTTPLVIQGAYVPRTIGLTANYRF